MSVMIPVIVPDEVLELLRLFQADGQVPPGLGEFDLAKLWIHGAIGGQINRVGDPVVARYLYEAYRVANGIDARYEVRTVHHDPTPTGTADDQQRKH